jgi:17beta-estradiol 17-dehydrogenase / very-long-chain 3-oxoacyl-CoA reductase
LTFGDLDDFDSRKNGLIMNVGSFAGILPQPMLSVYSSSKSFLSTWSQALGRELESSGITVECLNTYFVVSAMSKIRRSSFFIPTAKQFVDAASKRIGNPGGAGTPYCSSPYPSHAILNWIIDHVGSAAFWLELAYKTQVDVRKRALRKLSKSTEMKKEE